MKPVAENLLRQFDAISDGQSCKDWIFVVEKELMSNQLMDDEFAGYIKLAKSLSCTKKSNPVLNIVAKLKVL